MSESVRAIVFRRLNKTTFNAMRGRAAPGGGGGGQKDIRFGRRDDINSFFDAATAGHWLDNAVAVGTLKRATLQAVQQAARHDEWRITRQDLDRHPAWTEAEGFPARRSSRIPPIVLWICRTESGSTYVGMLAGGVSATDHLYALISMIMGRRDSLAILEDWDQFGILRYLGVEPSANDALTLKLPSVKVIGVGSTTSVRTAAAATRRRKARRKYNGPLGGTEKTLTLVQYRKRQAQLRSELLDLYDPKCAVCGLELEDAAAFEVEAAHVVPVERGGTTHPCNGLLLCRTHHWAFDRGLFFVGQAGEVVIVKAASTPMMHYLQMIEGRKIPVASARWGRIDRTALAIRESLARERQPY